MILKYVKCHDLSCHLLCPNDQVTKVGWISVLEDTKWSTYCPQHFRKQVDAQIWKIVEVPKKA